MRLDQRQLETLSDACVEVDNGCYYCGRDLLRAFVLSFPLEPWGDAIKAAMTRSSRRAWADEVDDIVAEALAERASEECDDAQAAWEQSPEGKAAMEGDAR